MPKSFFKILCFDNLLPYIGCLNFLEPQRGAEDDACEAVTGAGGEEQLCVLRARASDHAPICEEHIEPHEVVAEASFFVMVLSMHVARDRTAERDELRAGCNREEPSSGDEHFEYFREADARFADQLAGRFVE